MPNAKKKIPNILPQESFEELDHRLACGWHVEMDPSGQRKRYLKLLHSEEMVDYSE